MRRGDKVGMSACADELEAGTYGNVHTRAYARTIRATVAMIQGHGAEVVRWRLLAARTPSFTARTSALTAAAHWQLRTGDPKAADQTLWRAFDGSTAYRAACSMGVLRDLANLGPVEPERWWTAFRECQTQLKMSDAELGITATTEPILAVIAVHDLMRLRDKEVHARQLRREERKRAKLEASAIPPKD